MQNDEIKNNKKNLIQKMSKWEWTGVLPALQPYTI